MRKALLGSLGAALAALGPWLLPLRAGEGEAARSDEGRIVLGREIYLAECAACHGADLKGQPDWQSRLPSGRLPAPPHDASGHTWHHSDEVLFRIVKEGTAAVVGPGYESDMPGFREVLSDAEIEAVLAYIKSTWPERERAFQVDVTRAARAE